MKERVLTTRELNRALLARQLLLERSRLTLPRALEQVAGLQAQYAPSPYVRLWSCLERFERDDLTRALERKSAVQATLMRATIHVVSRRDYWPFAAAVGPSYQDWWRRTWGREHREADLDTLAARLQGALAGRTWERKELDEVVRAQGPRASGAWVGLVRVPPSGTWERRRANLFRLASEWLRPAQVSEDAGIERLLRRYLGAFGPARLADAANWGSPPVAKLRAVAERLQLRRFRDEQGRELVDLPRMPVPAAETRAPARFLPHWDAALLVHARRTLILPEEFRPLIFHTKAPHSFATFLVDGAVAGTWRVERTAKRATLVLEPFERLSRDARAELDGEGAGLARFHEPGATSFATRVARRS